MKYYKGACEQDVPYNGGQFVKENGFGHEEFNFRPTELDDAEQPLCLGFVEPKSNKGTRNTIHIEKIEGCGALKNAEAVDDVLVIWCATRLEGTATVVGWYKHATVFRSLQGWTEVFPDGSEEDRYYNVLAEAKNCVLLPDSERNCHIWLAQSAKYTKSYGFGQSMLWYPTEETAKVYLNKLIRNIDNYAGENWLHTYPNS